MCEQAPKEQDPKKLSELVEEIDPVGRKAETPHPSPTGEIMSCKVGSDSFIQREDNIKTAEKMDAAKKKGVREMIQESLESTRTKDQRSELLFTILKNDGFQIIPENEQTDYLKRVNEHFEDFGLSGPLD